MRLFVIFSALLSCGPALLADEVTDIERQCVEQRRELRSGEVIVRSHYRQLRDGNVVLERPRYYHIWWDGPRHRQDLVHVEDAFAAEPDGAERTVNIWADSAYYYWSSERSPNDLKQVAVAARIDDSRSIYDKKIDPRRIGMCPSSIRNLCNYPLDYLCTSPDRFETRRSATTIGDVSCDLVTWKNRYGATIRLWFAPQYGASIVKAEVVATVGGKTLVDAIDVKLQHDDRSGMWFPAECHYTQHLDEQLQREDQAVVEIVSLNQPIPREVFGFAGAGVPKGWPVSDRRRPDIEGNLAWDGRQIVSMDKAEQELVEAARWNVVYVVSSLLLAAVAGVLLWRLMVARGAVGG